MEGIGVSKLSGTHKLKFAYTYLEVAPTLLDQCLGDEPVVLKELVRLLACRSEG